MKLFVKILCGIGVIALITAGSFLLLSGNKVDADTNVDMGYFNKTIEELNTKIDNLNTEITAISSENKTLSEKVVNLSSDNESLKNDIKELTTKVNTNTTNITSCTNRVSKIELREDHLYDLFGKNYTGSGLSYYMKEFKEAQ